MTTLGAAASDRYTPAEARPLSLAAKHARLARGETQEQLAEHLGVRQRTVSQWETGENAMNEPAFARVAAAYNRTATELLDEWLGAPARAEQERLERLEKHGIEQVSSSPVK